MLRFNARASEQAGFISSEEDCPPRLIGVPFEHFSTSASVCASSSPLFASIHH
jgi:hypothetical protein